MSFASSITAIAPTYGTLSVRKSALPPTTLLRQICLYKWNVARTYLESRPAINAVQAGSHMTKWEWWVIRSEFGYLQCTLFDGEVMGIAQFTDDDPCYGVIESPVVSPIPVTISG